MFENYYNLVILVLSSRQGGQFVKQVSDKQNSEIVGRSYYRIIFKKVGKYPGYRIGQETTFEVGAVLSQASKIPWILKKAFAWLGTFANVQTDMSILKSKELLTDLKTRPRPKLEAIWVS